MRWAMRQRQAAADEDVDSAPSAPVPAAAVRTTAPSANAPGTTSEQAAPPGPVAVFARVIDGDSLWLAMERAGADDLFGHRLDDGSVEAISDDSGSEDDRLVVARTYLSSLTFGPDADRHRLVARHGDREWRPLGSAPLRDLDPLTTPPSTTSPWAWTVDRDTTGHLHLQRRPTPGGASLVAMGADDSAVLLIVAVDGDDVDSAVLLPDGAAAQAVTGHRDGHLLHLRIEPHDVPATGTPVPLHLRTSAGDLPVVRPRTDLARPAKSFAPPVVEAKTDDGSVSLTLRVRVDRQAQVTLVAQRADPTGEGDGEGDGEGEGDA